MSDFDALLVAETKHCRVCDTNHPADKAHWYFAKGKPAAPCKACRKEDMRRRYAENPELFNERHKSYRAANPEAYAGSAKRCREKDPVAYAAMQKRSYEKNREDRIAYERARRVSGLASAQERARRAADPAKYRAKKRAARAANPAHRARRAERSRILRAKSPERYRAYDTKRYATPKGNLNRRVSASLTAALKKRGARKTLPKSFILGWDIDDLVIHLEPLFEAGMSFDNYGEWDIDHIVPLARINFDSEAHPNFAAAWSLSNLAPLWGTDNGSKHARIDWELPDTYQNPLLRAMYANRNTALLDCADDFEGLLAA